MANSLDPFQARRFVGPDLGPNCLQRLSQAILVGKALTCPTVCQKYPNIDGISLENDSLTFALLLIDTR